MQRVNQIMSQTSRKQPVDQSMKLNRTANEPDKQSIKQAIKQSSNQTIKQSKNQALTHVANQTFNQASKQITIETSN